MQRTGEKLAYEDDEWSWLGGCIQENVSNRLRRVGRAIRTLCLEVLREGIVRKEGGFARLMDVNWIFVRGCWVISTIVRFLSLFRVDLITKAE